MTQFPHPQKFVQPPQHGQPVQFVQPGTPLQSMPQQPFQPAPAGPVQVGYPGQQPFQPVQQMFQPQPQQSGAQLAGTMFTGIERAKARVDANYIGVGRYWLKLNNCKAEMTQRSGGAFINEFTVVKVLDAHGGPGHRLLESVTHMIMAKQIDTFLPNVKAFLACAMSIDQSLIEQQHAQMVVQANQPLAGMVFDVEGRLVTTKKGHPFTAISYKGVISADRLIHDLDSAVKAAVFPGDYLERVFAFEQGNKPQAAQAPQQPQQGWQQPR